MKTFLLVSHENASAMAVMNGMAAFANRHNNLVIRAISTQFEGTLETIKEINPDAMLAHPVYQKMNPLLKWADENNKPLVALGHSDDPNAHLMQFDEEAIGRNAAEYFLKRGFSNFAYVGASESNFTFDSPAVKRFNGFRRKIENAGFHCIADSRLYSLSPWITGYTPLNFDAARETIRSWPTPCAVFCCTELTAYGFLELCLQMGFRIPDDFAILTAGDSNMLNRIARPSISTIPLDYFQMGYKAAELMWELIHNPDLEPQKIIIPTEPVITRESTDIIAADNSVVVNAVRFISENLHQPIKVQHIIDTTHVSRSLLEREFKKALNRTPLQEIHRQKINLAKELLVSTNKSIEETGNACGFEDQFQFSAFFRKRTGVSPSIFRKQNKR